MPFCPKCGTEYQDGSKFCAKCGANLDGSVAPVPINQKPGFFQEILDTKDVTSTMDANDINAGKAMSILAYCAVLAYILVTWLLGDFFCCDCTRRLARSSLYRRKEVGLCKVSPFDDIPRNTCRNGSPCCRRLDCRFLL